VADRWTVGRITHGLHWRSQLVAHRLRKYLWDRNRGDSFEQAVLAGHNLQSACGASDEIVRTWVDFALSSVERGRHAVQLMGGRRALREKRVLDVGCAYGGFLVAASQAGAREVIGIDISSELLDLARIQLKDYGIEAELAQADILRDDAIRFAPFDMVFCNDVVEHVVDLEALARNLSRLLVRNGSLFLSIPNGRSVDSMRSDNHYGLVGLTLLDREQAERWWRIHYRDEIYGVEHHAPLSLYIDLFSRHGISLRLLDSNPDSEKLTAMVVGLEERFDALDTQLASLHHDHHDAPELIDAIQERGAEEIDHFRRTVTRYRASRVPAEKAILGELLYDTYGRNAWQLKGVRV